MAATAVYARIAAIPQGNNHQGDAVVGYANISATTSPFTITCGGLFAVAVKGSTFGTVALQALGPDDTTYLPVAIQTGVAAGVATYVAAFVADGYGWAFLSPGQYRFAIA